MRAEESWYPSYNLDGRDEDEDRWRKYRRARTLRQDLSRVGTDPLTYLDENRDEDPWD